VAVGCVVALGVVVADADADGIGTGVTADAPEIP
jgi:hypothetical protein